MRNRNIRTVLWLTLVALFGVPSSSRPQQAKQTSGTRLYLEFGGDFTLLAKPTTVGSPSYWCLSPFDWKVQLEKSMKGSLYTFNLGLANQADSSPEGKLLAEILLRSDSKEEVLASTTFSTSAKYAEQKATVTGSNANAQPGNILILRVKRLEGMPCLYFAGETTDQFIEVPPTAIKSPEAKK